MARLTCGCCGAVFQPLNGAAAASGETWAHPISVECPWSEWEGLTTAQVATLDRIAKLEKLTTRLAEDLEYLAESTELDEADSRHIEEMRQLISDAQNEKANN